MIKLLEMAAEMSGCPAARQPCPRAGNTEASDHDHKQDAELRATQTRIAELERQHEEACTTCKGGTAHDYQDAQLRQQHQNWSNSSKGEEKIADLERKVSTPSAGSSNEAA